MVVVFIFFSFPLFSEDAHSMSVASERCAQQRSAVCRLRVAKQNLLVFRRSHTRTGLMTYFRAETVACTTMGRWRLWTCCNSSSINKLFSLCKPLRTQRSIIFRGRIRATVVQHSIHRSLILTAGWKSTSFVRHGCHYCQCCHALYPFDVIRAPIDMIRVI